MMDMKWFAVMSVMNGTTHKACVDDPYCKDGSWLCRHCINNATQLSVRELSELTIN